MLQKTLILVIAAMPVAALAYLFLRDVVAVPAPETLRFSFMGAAALGTFLIIFK